jgi:hypothetical protein
MVFEVSVPKSSSAPVLLHCCIVAMFHVYGVLWYARETLLRALVQCVYFILRQRLLSSHHQRHRLISFLLFPLLLVTTARMFLDTDFVCFFDFDLNLNCSSGIIWLENINGYCLKLRLSRRIILFFLRNSLLTFFPVELYFCSDWFCLVTRQIKTQIDIDVLFAAD